MKKVLLLTVVLVLILGVTAPAWAAEPSIRIDSVSNSTLVSGIYQVEKGKEASVKIKVDNPTPHPMPVTYEDPADPDIMINITTSYEYRLEVNGTDLVKDVDDNFIHTITPPQSPSVHGYDFELFEVTKIVTVSWNVVTYETYEPVTTTYEKSVDTKLLHFTEAVGNNNVLTSLSVRSSSSATSTAYSNVVGSTSSPLSGNSTQTLTILNSYSAQTYGYIHWALASGATLVSAKWNNAGNSITSGSQFTLPTGTNTTRLVLVVKATDTNEYTVNVDIKRATTTSLATVYIRNNLNFGSGIIVTDPPYVDIYSNSGTQTMTVTNSTYVNSTVCAHITLANGVTLTSATYGGSSIVLGGSAIQRVLTLASGSSTRDLVLTFSTGDVKTITIVRGTASQTLLDSVIFKSLSGTPLGSALTDVKSGVPEHYMSISATSAERVVFTLTPAQNITIVQLKWGTSAWVEVNSNTIKSYSVLPPADGDSKVLEVVLKNTSNQMYIVRINVANGEEVIEYLNYYYGTILYQSSATPATVRLYDRAKNFIVEATTTPDGKYTLPAYAGNGYILEVTKPGYLSYTIKNLKLDTENQIETIDITQLAGDIDGDGFVNAEDLTYLLCQFNKPPNEENNADIDGNGIVNAVDLTYLLAGFNKQSVVYALEDEEIYVVGVVCSIEPSWNWIGPVILDGDTAITNVNFSLQYSRVSVINTDGKEDTYSFSTDFRDGYNWLMNGGRDWAGSSDFWTGNVRGGAASKWQEAIAKMNIKADAFNGFYEGDIVMLVLDANDNIKRIDHFIAYEQGLKAKITVMSERERITIRHDPEQVKYDGAFILPSDAIVFRLNDTDEVDIVKASTILTEDFIADKVVAFDVKDSGSIKVLYYINATTRTKVGVFTRQGYSPTVGGDYYTINGVMTHSDDAKALYNPPILAAYTITGNKAVLGITIATSAGETGYATTDVRIPGLAMDTNGNYMAIAGIATYNAGINRYLTINGYRFYFSSDSYFYDLRDSENREISNFSLFTGQWAVIVYDSDFNIEVAVITK